MLQKSELCLQHTPRARAGEEQHRSWLHSAVKELWCIALGFGLFPEKLTRQIQRKKKKRKGIDVLEGIQGVVRDPSQQNKSEQEVRASMTIQYLLFLFCCFFF